MDVGRDDEEEGSGVDGVKAVAQVFYKASTENQPSAPPQRPCAQPVLS